MNSVSGCSVDKNSQEAEPTGLDRVNKVEVYLQNEETEVLKKMSLKEHLRMYWKFFFERGEKYPEENLPQQKTDIAELVDTNSLSLKAAWLGHSTLLLNMEGRMILTDPLFSKKVSPIGPVRFNDQLPIDVEKLPVIDVAIISHNHYDHLNKYSIKMIHDKVQTFIVPLGVGTYLEKWGVPLEKIVELNWWEEVDVADNLTIAATPAKHFSGRGLFDRNKSLWASWVLKGADHTVFFSGDGGYFEGFKQIGEKYGPFDVAYLECGAYNQNWSNVHMFPEETVQAYFDLKGKVLQPIHWATFNLAFHAWYDPIVRLVDTGKARNAQLSTPQIGQVVDYNRPLLTNHWWLPAIKHQNSSAATTDVALNPSR